MMAFLFLLLFTWHYLPYHVAAVETFTMTLPAGQHTCQSQCLLGNINGYDIYMAKHMGCASPWDNRCYCATAKASVSKASTFILNCVSSWCGAGDQAEDFTTMHAFYASYCIGAGYTQPGAADWLGALPTTSGPFEEPTAAPKPTAQPGDTTVGDSETVTRTGTAITTDLPGSPPQAPPPVTTTVFIHVDSSGRPVPDAATDSSQTGTVVGLGVGLGLGLPLLMAFGVVLRLLYRREQEKGTGSGFGPMFGVSGGGSSPRPPPGPAQHEPRGRNPSGDAMAQAFQEFMIQQFQKSTQARVDVGPSGWRGAPAIEVIGEN